MRYASITISWVADEKPNKTAAHAIVAKVVVAGSIKAIAAIDSIIINCDNNNHARRRPKNRVNSGTGKLSTNGAQTNLNE